MPKLFAENRLDAVIKTLPFNQFRPLPDINFSVDAICVPGEAERAEELLGKPVPQLPASKYMQYMRTGDRRNYEGPYFSRRSSAMRLLLAELTERKGRFTDLLVDYVWAICEESTWILPAHYYPNHGNPLNCLPDAFNLKDGDDVRQIDLFSAATGGMLAWIWYLGAGILDGVTPVIRRRIADMLKARILHVFYDVRGENNWWMGERGERLNNWTPWIVENVLTVVMLCEDNDVNREHAVRRSIEMLDRFTGNYPDDGGCDEGPVYWGHAAASYFDCAELIRDITGGLIDVTGLPFVRKMCEYIADFNLGGANYANFADASHRIWHDFATIARMGRITGSEKLTAFAFDNADRENFNGFSSDWVSYRSMRNLFEPFPEKPADARDPGHVWYPDLETMIVKNPSNGISLAAKAGGNNDSHNHNDTGSFILLKNGRPVFIDPGVEEYTKDTFSLKRYTIWTMRSLYHNLPSVNGFEQPAGEGYKSKVLMCDGKTLKMELKNAYPPESGIKTYVRTLSLDDEGFKCVDSLALEREGFAEFVLMCAEEPDANEKTIRVSGASAELVGFVSCETEAVPLGRKLSGEWSSDHLTRIKLKSGKFREAVFTLSVR